MFTIAEVVAFAEQRQPGFSGTLVAATEPDIVDLANLAGRALPARFLELLRIMGMRTGALRLADADFDIQALIARYDVNQPQHDRRYILLAIDEGEMCLDYYIDCARGNGDDGPVVRFDYESAPQHVRTIYTSLYEMVHASVFHASAIASRTHHLDDTVALARPDVLLTSWRDILSKLGFRPPLGETSSLCAVERPDAAVMARSLPEQPRVAFSIGAQSKAEMMRLRELLLDAIPSPDDRRPR